MHETLTTVGRGRFKLPENFDIEHASLVIFVVHLPTDITPHSYILAKGSYAIHEGQLVVPYLEEFGLASDRVEMHALPGVTFVPGELVMRTAPAALNEADVRRILQEEIKNFAAKSPGNKSAVPPAVVTPSASISTLTPTV